VELRDERRLDVPRQPRQLPQPGRRADPQEPPARLGPDLDRAGTEPTVWRISTDRSGHIYTKGHLGTTPKKLYVAKLSLSLTKVWEYVDAPGAQYTYYDYGRLYLDANGNILTGGALQDVNTGQWYWYALQLNRLGSGPGGA